MGRYSLKHPDLKIAILRGENFQSTTGSLRGERVPPGWIPPHNSQLPKRWSDQMWAENPVYVVLSYQTPIAWAIPTTETAPAKWNEYTHQWEKQSQVKAGYWVVPNVKYSGTTIRHQSIVLGALNASGLVPKLIRELEDYDK